MRRFGIRFALPFLLFAAALLAGTTAMAEGDPHKAKHVIVIMQENHSFDNYFGALAYAPGSPYHSPRREDGDDHDGDCRKDDHSCVDGLSCRVDAAGNFTCRNANKDDDGSTVFAFHDSRRCVAPDLDHGWASTHREANFNHPNDTLFQSLMDGFVLINDKTEQLDNGVENATDDQTMAFYNQNEIPFYYDLAQKFSVNGQAFVSLVLNAVRNSPFWNDTIILFTYDEHGGFYDHVQPPRARQGHAPNPDGISPGQCADLSNPPLSLQPGKGAECSFNLLSATDTTTNDAADLCPQFALDPTGPFPAACANFDQYGVRVPFVAISPFSKPSYVSHTVGDHTSILALIETIFMTPTGSTQDDDEDEPSRPHLTKRDQHANKLLDMFDFNKSPSLNTKIGVALPPAQDCTPTR